VVIKSASLDFNNETREKNELESENALLKMRIAELETLVLLDTLTPLYNRRHFMDTLERRIWRIQRYGGESGLLFIDVDQLKNVNDALGHLAGDKLLITVADKLLTCVRRSDIIARIGGDEFAILLEQTDPAALPIKASDIAKKISTGTVDYNGVELIPSISVGYAMLEPHVSSAEVLMRADQSMYAARAERAQIQAKQV
jgi:diguanylate cyclase (GGDEF)-like protein